MAERCITISFVNNRTIERLYAEKTKGSGNCRYNINSYDDEDDDEVLPLSLNDYEERLGKGFRIFDMATKGYPSDG